MSHNPLHASLHLERCESRRLCAADSTGHMRIGMNLERVADWSPAWTFTDAFQSSRPWIAHAVNVADPWQTIWDVGATRPIQVDGNGVPVALQNFSQNGQTYRQAAGTLMFRELGGAYPAGTYRAEWRGTGQVSFGFDAREVSRGTLPDGRSFANLSVTPSDGGIHLRIDATSPADPIRDIHVWMPDYGGQSFAGQVWQPNSSFSPFHPLFRERLAPFGVLRFMGMQETNSSDIRTWADRRDPSDMRQASESGPPPTPSPVNGMALEYMVRLANDLDADPWFNMPHMADDDFVRNFATTVKGSLEPDRKVYVEWSNEIWNFAHGFEASQWVVDQMGRREYAGLDNWQVAGREAKRDLDIWAEVFRDEPQRLVRVAAGWAANDWVTGRIVESMDGSFDAIAIAPYFSPSDSRRETYTSATTVEEVLADSRTGITEAIGWTANHKRLADQWTTTLGRPIQLVAYEGGPHLDGRTAPYQDVFYAAGNDPRMGDLYRDYLRGLDAAGMSLYCDFQFTGSTGASSWGDFAKLHRMDQPLETAHRYRAVLDAATGALWGTPTTPQPPTPPAPLPTMSIASAEILERNRGVRRLNFTIMLSTPATTKTTVQWATVDGSATAGSDYEAAGGTLVIPRGQTSRKVRVIVKGDVLSEGTETFGVVLSSAVNATIMTNGATAVGTIFDDDPAANLALAAAMQEDSRKPRAGCRPAAFPGAL